MTARRVRSIRFPRATPRSRPARDTCSTSGRIACADCHGERGFAPPAPTPARAVTPASRPRCTRPRRARLPRLSRVRADRSIAPTACQRCHDEPKQHFDQPCMDCHQPHRARRPRHDVRGVSCRSRDQARGRPRLPRLPFDARARRRPRSHLRDVSREAAQARRDAGPPGVQQLPPSPTLRRAPSGARAPRVTATSPCWLLPRTRSAPAATTLTIRRHARARAVTTRRSRTRHRRTASRARAAIRSTHPTSAVRRRSVARAVMPSLTMRPAACLDCHDAHGAPPPLTPATCARLSFRSARQTAATGHANCVRCHATAAHQPATPPPSCASCHPGEARGPLRPATRTASAATSPRRTPRDARTELCELPSARARTAPPVTPRAIAATTSTPRPDQRRRARAVIPTRRGSVTARRRVRELPPAARSCGFCCRAGVRELPSREPAAWASSRRPACAVRDLAIAHTKQRHAATARRASAAIAIARATSPRRPPAPAVTRSGSERSERHGGQLRERADRRRLSGDRQREP